MTFLQEVASDLYKRYDGDLSSLVIMFPSQRARVFFNDAFVGIANKPFWQPSYMTIDEMMEHIAGLRRGERFLLISELFKIYKNYHPSETIDKFYFWGDMLISDFDQIDKYMVDAERLLRNIENLKELETDVDYLSEEQIRCIRTFWQSIVDKKSLSEQKLRFLKIWKSLPHIYREYRERLISLGIGYPGLIYREAAHRLKTDKSDSLFDKRVIVAGFNALSKSERCLMDYLQNSRHGVEFFWDYDEYYTKGRNNEAGRFMRENIARYPMRSPISKDNFNERNKEFKSIGCVSNVAQCKYVAEILSSLPAEELDKRTAIVLTDENMLIPLLHSIPKCVERVNITMGYPLKATLAYTFIERIIDLQRHSRMRDEEATFYHVDVCGILTHPYIGDACKSLAQKLHRKILKDRLIHISRATLSENDLLSLIFTKAANYEQLSQQIHDILGLLCGSIAEQNPIQADYLRIAQQEVAKCIHSIAKCDIEISSEVFISTLRKHLQTITRPYEGEPLEGVQIMGILETRNIDFKNVIILSMTDATFPGDAMSKASFIPYNLRIGYDMPTPEEHEAMYAYYFYRLIQRAERVSMLYCSKADDKSTGECSRYIHQLDFESHYPIKKLSIGVDLSLEAPTDITIPKGEHERKVLETYLDGGEAKLSPSSLFRYVQCPLKFYFASIAKLRTPDEINDKVDALTFGNIMHDSMEALYKNDKILKVTNPAENIKSELYHRDVVQKCVNKVICKLIYKSDADRSKEFSGDIILVRDIIVRYILEGILRFDKEQSGYTIEGLEKSISTQYPISGGRMVNLEGRADRIDRLSDGTLRIIDYKSSAKSHQIYDGIENLFIGNDKQRIDNVFQTLLYSEIVHRADNIDTQPALYYASQMLSGDYSPKLQDAQTKSEIERYSNVGDQFRDHLGATLDELFDYDTPFKQVDESLGLCTYCNYNKICRRTSKR